MSEEIIEQNKLLRSECANHQKFIQELQQKYKTLDQAFNDLYEMKTDGMIGSVVDNDNLQFKLTAVEALLEEAEKLIKESDGVYNEHGWSSDNERDWLQKYNQYKGTK